MLQQAKLELAPTSPITFTFETFAVRTFTVEDQLWFAAQDVCTALNLNNSSQAISRLDADERGVISGVISSDPSQGPRDLATINESGLYALILTSRRPEAQRFKRWVTHEVLPAIRRTGTYTAQPTPPANQLAIIDDPLNDADYRKEATNKMWEFRRQCMEAARAAGATDLPKLPDIDAKTIDGLVADALMFNHWVLSYDNLGGYMHLRRIERGEFTMSLDTLPERLPNLGASNEQLAQIAVACTATLAKRMGTQKL